MTTTGFVQVAKLEKRLFYREKKMEIENRKNVHAYFKWHTKFYTNRIERPAINLAYLKVSVFDQVAESEKKGILNKKLEIEKETRKTPMVYVTRIPNFIQIGSIEQPKSVINRKCREY